jgi:hypothetical protein
MNNETYSIQHPYRCARDKEKLSIGAFAQSYPSHNVVILRLCGQKQTAYHTSHITNFSPNVVVLDGESGPGGRPIMQKWVTDIRDQCLGAKVPFFFKQWGGVQKKRAGRTLEGRTWDEMPVNVGMVKA